MSRIRLFNTLSGKKEELATLIDGQARVYVCGPTTYNLVHLGNARTFTSFDMIVRYLRYRGLNVTYVRNFTDVDDKIINAAAKTGEAAIALSARFVEEFRKDARELGLIEPDVAPKVSEHMPEIIAIIEKLISRGVAYESRGDVYFAVKQYPQYAKLSGRQLEDLKSGVRVEPGEQKHDPLDFALWKAAKPAEPSWDSPWGKGRPGWHIECSAMSAKYLGESFDIHGGGRDLIFPHHENELAQSEAAWLKPFAKYWLHGGMLELKVPPGTDPSQAKMSKSLGNVFMLRDALQLIDAEALRWFLLSTHYRNPLEFSEQSMRDAEARLGYFYETLRKVDERIAGKSFGDGETLGEPHEALKAFEAEMDDDFNVPGAMAAFSSLFARMNELVDKPPSKDKALVSRTLAGLRAEAAKMGGALGMLQQAPTAWLERRRARVVKQKGIDEPKVLKLIEDRLTARKTKDFQRADQIRGELKTMGVELMDTPAGTSWKVLP